MEQTTVPKGLLSGLAGVAAVAAVVTEWPLLAAAVAGFGAVAGAGTLLWRRAELRRLSRWIDDRCEGCGYDLRGLGGSGRCPECGKAFKGLGVDGSGVRT